jgi:ABC-type multidrug transport system fused ATPase/permease subunit
LPLLLLLSISLVGAVFFWLPKIVTVRAAAHTAKLEGDDTIVTHRVLVGGVAFPLWIALTSAIVALVFDWKVGLLSLLLQPVWAFAALAVGERRQAMWTAVRRYVLRRFIGDRLEPLRVRQRGLAEQLRVLLVRTVVSPS